MLSRQGTQELGQEDQIDEISSRHWEAVGTECRESPNLTRFCRLAQQPYHDLGATLARHAHHDAPKIRKAACLGYGQAYQADPFQGQSLLQHGHTNACQALLNRCAGGRIILKPTLPGDDVPSDGGSKERLLVAEPRIDRRLARARNVSDLFNICAFKSAIEKYFAGRIEDSLLDLSGEFARRAARAPPGL